MSKRLSDTLTRASAFALALSLTLPRPALGLRQQEVRDNAGLEEAVAAALGRPAAGLEAMEGQGRGWSREVAYPALRELMEGYRNLRPVSFSPGSVEEGTLVIADLSEQPEYAGGALWLPNLGPNVAVLAESAEAVTKAMMMTGRPAPSAGLNLIYVRDEQGQGTLEEAVRRAIRRVPGVRTVRILSTRSRADWDRDLSGTLGGTSLLFDLGGAGLRVKEILLNLGATASAGLEALDRLVEGSIGLGRFL